MAISIPNKFQIRLFFIENYHKMWVAIVMADPVNSISWIMIIFPCCNTCTPPACTNNEYRPYLFVKVTKINIYLLHVHVFACIYNRVKRIPACYLSRILRASPHLAYLYALRKKSAKFYYAYSKVSNSFLYLTCRVR